MAFVTILFFFLVIVPSSILHEYAHGWVADRLGDPTARLAGRLTINPRPHIDMWGTLLLPIILLIATRGSFMFAYAKPVPYNPLALRWQKWGSAAVGLAGPAANLIIAFGLGILIRFLPISTFTSLLSIVVYANIVLAVFNLVPIPPLDGSKLLFTLLPDRFYAFKFWLEQYGLFILLFFLFFGLQWLSPLVFKLLTLAIGPKSLTLLFGL